MTSKNKIKHETSFIKGKSYNHSPVSNGGRIIQEETKSISTLNKLSSDSSPLDKNKENSLIGWSDEDIKLATDLHNTYEVLSKEENWVTQDSTHLKAFRSLPKENQRVMLRLANIINAKIKNNPKVKNQATYSINYSTDVYSEFLELVKVIDTFNTEVKK